MYGPSTSALLFIPTLLPICPPASILWVKVPQTHHYSRLLKLFLCAFYIPTNPCRHHYRVGSETDYWSARQLKFTTNLPQGWPCANWASFFYWGQVCCTPSEMASLSVSMAYNNAAVWGILVVVYRFMYRSLRTNSAHVSRPNVHPCKVPK